MPDPLDAETERALIDWIETRTHAGPSAHARGNQGLVYLYQMGGQRFVVKVAHGRGLKGYVRRWMLRREHTAYRRLEGFAGSPHCFGLLRERYLVLDYVDGVPLRQAQIEDPRLYFDTLFAYVQELHRRGVAHADLKRKDNLLVIDKRLPRLIDFGAAVVRKPGFAPINHYLYDLARRFDLNAWVKLKYDNRMHEMTPEDNAYYVRTGIEIIARAVKRSYLKLKYRLFGQPQ